MFLLKKKQSLESLPPPPQWERKPQHIIKELNKKLKHYKMLYRLLAF